MPTPIREAALAAIADRLAAELPSVVLERARRAPLDTDKEPLPRLVLTGTDWEADETAEPGSTHYTLGFVVAGYARDTTDLGLEQGLSDLHATVVAALVGWTPAVDGLGEAAEQGAEFRLYDTDESSKPTSGCLARFPTFAVVSLGSPDIFQPSPLPKRAGCRDGKRDVACEHIDPGVMVHATPSSSGPTTASTERKARSARPSG